MREFKRVVRDRCKQRLEMQEEEERERLRNMTEEERVVRDETESVKRRQRARQGKVEDVAFMQKYYHKGAFFQDAGDDEFATTEKAEIFNRDFNEATNAEKGVDRTTVPEAMRLRQGQFGKAGRSSGRDLEQRRYDVREYRGRAFAKRATGVDEAEKLEEQQPGADGGVEENKSGGNFPL